jgi:hypothetical protein
MMYGKTDQSRREPVSHMQAVNEDQSCVKSRDVFVKGAAESVRLIFHMLNSQPIFHMAVWEAMSKYVKRSDAKAGPPSDSD